MGGTSKKFQCVYSEELLHNKGQEILIQKETKPDSVNNPVLKDDNWSAKKAKINGTTSYIPAMFGMTIAGLVVQAIQKEVGN